MQPIARCTIWVRSLPRKRRSPLGARDFQKGLNRSRNIQRLNTIIMKKFISLLIGCSLTLAGAAFAQQPADEQQSPSKGKKRAPEKAHATEAQPRGNAAKPQERPGTQPGATKQRGRSNERSATNERGARNQPDAEKTQKTHAAHESANAPETNESTKSTGKTANEPGAGKGRKDRTQQEETANAPDT